MAQDAVTACTRDLASCGFAAQAAGCDDATLAARSPQREAILWHSCGSARVVPAVFSGDGGASRMT